MTEPIKLLHIISDFRRGGRERQLAVLVNFSNAKIKHVIATLNDVSDSYIDEYGLEQPKKLGVGKIERIRNLVKLIKENKIDLIHSWGNSEMLYSIPASLLLGVPILNGSIRHGIRKNNFGQLFRSFVLQHSKFVLGNSIAGFAANKIKINNKRHFVLYNGIEDKFFITADTTKKKEFLQKKNLGSDAIIFISIANFMPYKDYFTIIKSLNIFLKNESKNFHYIIIGKGKMEDEIKAYIKDMNLEGLVSIYNKNPNIPELLSISDIMIHSSLGEGCSNAILEAKAAGLRVIASNTGGTKEILNSEDLLFEYKNTDDLVNKIKVTVKSLKENANNKTEIQKRIKERFSVNNMQQKYYEIIKSILMS